MSKKPPPQKSDETKIKPLSESELIAKHLLNFITKKKRGKMSRLNQTERYYRIKDILKKNGLFLVETGCGDAMWGNFEEIYYYKGKIFVAYNYWAADDESSIGIIETNKKINDFCRLNLKCA